MLPRIHQRIWTNRDALAARLEKDISDLIVLGKNPTQIKKKLKEDLDISYRAADRLIRTESAHIYTQASIDSYKKAGVKQVKYLHRGVCSGKCDCHSLDGQIFDIGTEPTLPRHPNCVCCYVPVIDLTVAAKSDIVIPKDMWNQSAARLRKGIKSNDEIIERHEYKLAHPDKFYADWYEVDDGIKEGRLGHWRKEIKTAKRNQEAARYVLRERGE